MTLKSASLFLFFIKTIFITVEGHRNMETQTYAFDDRLYEDVLDPEKCEQQLDHLITSNSILGLKFLDAGIRIPKGILIGNLIDLGNYHQCIAINEDEENLNIQGKYCIIDVPLNQLMQLTFSTDTLRLDQSEQSGFLWAELNKITLLIDNITLKNVQEYNKRKLDAQQIIGAKFERSEILVSSLSLYLAICVPKTCTPGQFMDKMFFNISSLGLKYETQAVRISDDKPWVPVDYLALTIFSLIGLIIILSTGYDIHQTIILKQDSKKVKTIYMSLSLYTNTQTLFTFSTKPSEVLECLDGIRALAMIRIVLLHAFSTQRVIANPLDHYEWQQSYRALWVTSAITSVDTFFTLSGLLVVYSTAGKLDNLQLLKNVHIFYLHRILRMFPVLAAMVLVQASFFNQVVDGPLWFIAASEVDTCRKYWWTTLLYVQNYAYPGHICLGHSWYLAVDFQLYILSPLVLFWILIEKRNHIKAWIALTAALIISLSSATAYNAINQFPSTTFGQTNTLDYSIYYYINTLTRASPFIVGMCFGYVLHIWRGKKLRLSKILVVLIWLLTAALSGLVTYLHYAIVQENWNNTTGDVFVNSFMRPIWALAICCVIVMCVHSYGGPINWFLSHQMWKLPSRLSYAMYLVHYPLMIIIMSKTLTPFYFSVEACFFNFLAYLMLTVLVSILVTVAVESPFLNIVKLIPCLDFKKSNVQSNKKPDSNAQHTDTNADLKAYKHNSTHYEYNKAGSVEPTTEL